MLYEGRRHRLLYEYNGGTSITDALLNGATAASTVVTGSGFASGPTAAIVTSANSVAGNAIRFSGQAAAASTAFSYYYLNVNLASMGVTSYSVEINYVAAVTVPASFFVLFGGVVTPSVTFSSLGGAAGAGNGGWLTTTPLRIRGLFDHGSGTICRQEWDSRNISTSTGRYYTTATAVGYVGLGFGSWATGAGTVDVDYIRVYDEGM